MRRPAPARVPTDWTDHPAWAVLTPVKETNKPDLGLLSVYRDYGVIPRDSRDDNFNKASLDLTKYQVVRPGRVVANKMKTWQGSIAVSNLEGIVSPAYMVFDAAPTVHGRFLHYLLRSGPYVAEYAKLSYGVRPAQWDLRWEDLRDIRLLMPPVDAQRRIADFLDRETSRIDALMDSKKGLIGLLAEKRTALITHTVTKGLDPSVPMKDSRIASLGEIPRHWDLAPLKRVARVRYGLGQPPPPSDSGIPVIRATNIDQGRIEQTGMMFARLQDIPIERAPLLAEGEILVVRSGANTGDSAIVPRQYEGAAPGYDLRVTVTDALPEFVAWSLLSDPTRHQMDLMRGRAAQPHLNADQVANLQFPMPEMEEQASIARRLEHLTSVINALRASLTSQLALLSEYRQALITAAVTGQLDEATMRGARPVGESIGVEVPA